MRTHGQFMAEVETERLLLRMFRPEDLDDLATLFRDPEVMRYVGDGKPASREEAEKALESIIRHWSSHGFGRWAVVDKHTHHFLGFGGLRSLFGVPEVVYHFAVENWGQGFATELARASLRYGFENHRFERIVAIAKPGNTASTHVMEKLGMKFQQHARYYNIDVVEYAIASGEFHSGGATYVLKDSRQS